MNSHDNTSTTSNDDRYEDPAWNAVDEDTRKECFDIFVEHLGSHSKKKERSIHDKKLKRK